MIMAIAEKYGVLPDQVESMDEYWFNRTALMMQGESRYRESQERKAQQRRR